MCTVLLPPGGYPIAVKYIISYQMCVGLHVKYPLFSSDFKETWISWTDFRKLPCGRVDEHTEEHTWWSYESLFVILRTLLQTRSAINLKRVNCYCLFTYLCIYGLCNGVVSSPESIATSDRNREKYMEKMWEKNDRDLIWGNSPYMRMKMLRKKPREFIWFQGQNLNQGTPNTRQKIYPNILNLWFLSFLKIFWALFYRLLLYRLCKTHRNTR
jgi:hypothetical protein